MAALPALITVEELRTLDTPDRCELHHGTIVPVTSPALKHEKMQWHLQQLLQRALGFAWIVPVEFSYRPLPQFELRRGDVVAISRARWDAGDPDDNIHGAPELVIEVKSPSNRPRQLRELASLCLANGCQSFWVIDLEAKTVTTVGPDGKSTLYKIGESIPLTVVPGYLDVSEIFASDR